MTRSSRRTKAAQALVDWLATEPTGNGDPDFLIIGDLNAYAMEDPVAAIKAAGYTNLTESYIGASAYSYVFEGQFGYLDHAPTLWWGGECQPGAAGSWRDRVASFSALRTGIDVRPLDGSTSRVRWTISTTTSRGCIALMRIGRRTTIRRLWG